MRAARLSLAALILLIAGAMAWVRLAPDDPARWQVPVDSPGAGARATVLLADPDPAAVLARLDRIALATARTRRLAGSPGAGRITWVTRSALFGFPDYTTAEARPEGRATRLALWARQRYGRGDFGVNQARLDDWLARLAP